MIPRISINESVDGLVTRINDAFCDAYNFAHKKKGPNYSHGMSGTMRAVKQRAIINALRMTQGDVDEAAKLLGLSRSTLYRWFNNCKPHPSAIRARKPATE